VPNITQVSSFHEILYFHVIILDKNSFNFNKSQPLLIPGKTLNPAVAFFHKFKVPLTVIGGVSSVIYAFGVKNTFVFLGQSIGISLLFS
jgi:hypothetical protein